MCGAWKPKLSGMRRWDGSHCVFRRMGPRKRGVTTAPRRFAVLTRSPSRCVCVWCIETQAEWDAAVGCLAVSISPNRPSKTRCHAGTSKTPCFNTITVEIDMCLVRGDPICVGCGGVMPRMRFSLNGPSKTRCHDDTSKTPCFYTTAFDIGMCLVRGDPS